MTYRFAMWKRPTQCCAATWPRASLEVLQWLNLCQYQSNLHLFHSLRFHRQQPHLWPQHPYRLQHQWQEFQFVLRTEFSSCTPTLPRNIVSIYSSTEFLFSRTFVSNYFFYFFSSFVNLISWNQYSTTGIAKYFTCILFSDNAWGASESNWGVARSTQPDGRLGADVHEEGAGERGPRSPACHEPLTATPHSEPSGWRYFNHLDFLLTIRILSQIQTDVQVHLLHLWMPFGDTGEARAAEEAWGSNPRPGGRNRENGARTWPAAQWVS